MLIGSVKIVIAFFPFRPVKALAEHADTAEFCRGGVIVNKIELVGKQVI